MQSHYETLMISTNASPEIIDSAYKALEKKYTGQLNNVEDQAEADQLNELLDNIKTAYTILANPESRKDHDEALKGIQVRPASDQSRTHNSFGTSWPRKYWYLILGTFIFSSTYYALNMAENYSNTRHIKAEGQSLLTGDTTHQVKNPFEAPTASSTRSATDPSIQARTDLTPLGYPWPEFPSYLRGYPVIGQQSPLTLTFNNMNNNAAIFAKLVMHDRHKLLQVRAVYIPARQIFKMDNIGRGIYDIRWQNLASGKTFRIEPFSMFEAIDQQSKKPINEFVMYFRADTKGNIISIPIGREEF